MGFSISWLAVNGKEPGTVTSALGLKANGVKSDYADEMYTGRTLPNGWFLLVINRCDDELLASDSLSVLSKGSEVIACSIEEHVMVSTSELWKDGINIWRIEHNAQERVDHIYETGALPEGYSQIKDSLSKEQEQEGGLSADVDCFFDIPLETAKTIVGFKHDEECGLEANSFDVFDGTTASSKPWWKFWQ